MVNIQNIEHKNMSMENCSKKLYIQKRKSYILFSYSSLAKTMYTSEKNNSISMFSFLCFSLPMKGLIHLVSERTFVAQVGRRRFVSRPIIHSMAVYLCIYKKYTSGGWCIIS